MTLTMDNGQELSIKELKSYTVNDKQKVIVFMTERALMDSNKYALEALNAFFGEGGWLLTTVDSTEVLPIADEIMRNEWLLFKAGYSLREKMIYGPRCVMSKDVREALYFLCDKQHYTFMGEREYEAK